MEKVLKSCTGVLLRADLTRHGQFSQSANFCQKGWDGRALLGQPSKDNRWKISIFFLYVMFYYIISTTYQKIGDLFCSLIFLQSVFDSSSRNVRQPQSFAENSKSVTPTFCFCYSNFYFCAVLRTWLNMYSLFLFKVCLYIFS